MEEKKVYAQWKNKTRLYFMSKDEKYIRRYTLQKGRNSFSRAGRRKLRQKLLSEELYSRKHVPRQLLFAAQRAPSFSPCRLH